MKNAIVIFRLLLLFFLKQNCFYWVDMYNICRHLVTKFLKHKVMFIGQSVTKILFVLFVGARCSSVVRAFAHGAMGHRIDPSWWTH